MSAAYFYHLTRRQLQTSLPELLSKALRQGWSIEVRTPNAEKAAWIDDMLWIHPEHDFLAHGIATGQGLDADHPILISNGPALGAPRDCVICVEGAEVSESDIANSARTCIMFDGTSDPATQVARTQWKSLVDAGVAAKYFSEETGNWTLKFEKNV